MTFVSLSEVRKIVLFVDESVSRAKIKKFRDGDLRQLLVGLSKRKQKSQSASLFNQDTESG